MTAIVTRWRRPAVIPGRDIDLPPPDDAGGRRSDYGLAMPERDPSSGEPV
jgi:DNA-binding NarL/FixJ family response regulator